MNKIKVGIIDYKIGNHHSVKRIFKELGCETVISSDIYQLKKSDLLVLPGVGTFPYAMQKLKELKLDFFIKKWAAEKKYLLGICLGMQLLCDSSKECFKSKGLGIIPGEVIPIKKSKFHIGWNSIKILKKNKMYHDFHNNYFFFNHSFMYNGTSNYEIAKTKLEIKIPAIISNNNTFGFQFHPEKSQLTGKFLLEYFLKSIRNVD